jgi:hypothetical protein
MSKRKIKSISLVAAGAATFALASSPALSAPQVNEIAGLWKLDGEVTSDPWDCAPTEIFSSKLMVAADGSLTSVEADASLSAFIGQAYRLGGKRYALGLFGYVTGFPLDLEIQSTLDMSGSAAGEGLFRVILSSGGITVCEYEGVINGTRLDPQPF